MKNHVSNNLKYLRDLKGLSQGELSEELALNRNNIASYERGVAPKLDALSRIANYFNTTIDDFINKDLSDPYITEQKKEVVNEKIFYFSMAGEKNHVSQNVPLYNIEAAAGLVHLFNEASKQNTTDFISIPNLPKCDGAIHVTGDSMYPLLKSGDIVLYKQINDVKNNIFWGEMYLISLDLEGEEFIMVKYIQRSEQKEHIKLVSHNQHHSDKEVHISKVKALALVKASIRINSMK